MAFTCYASLHNPQLGQVGPPAQVGLHASYFIVDTTINKAIPTISGELNGDVTALISTPVTNQQSLLTATQTAIQARETATPGLSFVWTGLG